MLLRLIANEVRRTGKPNRGGKRFNSKRFSEPAIRTGNSNRQFQEGQRTTNRRQKKNGGSWANRNSRFNYEPLEPRATMQIIPGARTGSENVAKASEILTKWKKTRTPMGAAREARRPLGAATKAPPCCRPFGAEFLSFGATSLQIILVNHP